MIFFHLSGDYEKGTSLLIYSAAWGKKVKMPTVKSKSRQTPWHLQSGGCGRASWVQGCRVWLARGHPVAPVVPCWVSWIGSTRWCRAASLTETWACCCASTSGAGLAPVRSFTAIGQATPSCAMRNFKQASGSPPLKWCIWVFEDGGSRNVQSIWSAYIWTCNFKGAPMST